MTTRLDASAGPGAVPTDPVRGPLAAAGLPAAWAGRDAFVVLALGLDACLAIGAARRAWCADPARCARLHWAAWLPEPPSPAALAGRLDALRVPAASREPLLARWPLPIDGVFRLPVDGDRVVLTLAIGEARRMLPGWLARADALLIGLDAAPAANAAALRAAAGLLGADALVGAGAFDTPVAATARARAAPMLHALADAGLQFEAHGELTWRGRRVRGRTATPSGPADRSARRAIVVGGGLAGTASAAALARRGWSVRRLDGRAPRASSQPVLAQHPSLTPDDAPLSRLTRAATLLSHTDPSLDGVLRWHGRLQLADAERAASVVARWPRDWVEAIDAAEASRRAGVALRQGGWWLPMAGCADPDALRDAWTRPDVDVASEVDVACIVRERDCWALVDAAGRTVDSAPVVVVATGAGSPALRTEPRGSMRALVTQLGPAGLQRRSGMTTVATLPPEAVPRCTVGGDGHAVPIDATRLLLGPPGPAANDGPAADDAPARAWRRWSTTLATAPPSPVLAEGRAGERVSTRDHLPVIGPVPDAAAVAAMATGSRHDDRRPLPVLDGLWIASAFGGRGLLWAVLAGELLAARLTGEPAPLEHDLARRLAPERFLRHALRRVDASG